MVLTVIASPMKYLVTGGAGFIGSHLVEALVLKGEEVCVLDNFSTGKEENLAPFSKQIHLIRGDICNKNVCEEACDGVNYVFHEAALGSVPRSVEDPLTTHEVNITGTLNLLLAARDAKVKRFIFASSSSVYGDAPTLPKVESMPPNPLSPYALSKYAAETYVALFYKLYGLETISLRYFNVYGPRQDPNSQYAAVIPAFIAALKRDQAPVIYGDGEQTRDFTFVKDVVEANLLACVANEDACGRAYNIACHQRTTINQLFKMTRELISKLQPQSGGVNPVYRPGRVGDIRDSLADYGLAKKWLNFFPAWEMHKGMAETIPSYCS